MIEPDEIEPTEIGELEIRIDDIGGVHIDAPEHERLSISKERFAMIINAWKWDVGMSEAKRALNENEI